MARAEAEAVVDAPPADVYAIIADYREHHPRILPRPPFEDLRVVEGGRGAGTRIEVGMRIMGRAQRFRMRVVEPEPGRVLEEHDEETGVVTSFTVTPEDGGARSRVRIATEWTRGGLAAWLAARAARGIYEKELRKLQEYAAARPPAMAR